jgi:hypothetical protein
MIMGKFSLTWGLMKSSWELLKKDKEVLIFPFISGICCILLMLSFALPIINSPEVKAAIQNHQEINYGKYYLLMFIFYFLNYLIIIFFNTAVVAAANIRLNGGDPKVSDGFNGAMAILPLIIVWSLVAATVGLVLRAIEERSNTFGRIMAGLLGLAWSIVSFLVIPIFVVEKKGPFAALKESTLMMKKTWGEQLIGRFSFGLVFFVFSIPAFILIALGVATRAQAVLIFFVALGVIYLIILALIQSALQSIFQTVVYKYSHDKQAPTGFSEQDIMGAFGPKKASPVSGFFRSN